MPDNCFAFPTQTGRALLEQVVAEKNLALNEATLELAYALGLELHLDKRGIRGSGPRLTETGVRSI